MKSRNGLAFCLSVALASVANAGVVIELVPDDPGPYNGGETLTVEVFLRQDPADVDHLLRLVQLDLTDTNSAIGIGVPEIHTGIKFWYFGTTQHCIDNAADCGADHYIDGSRIDALPPGANILVVAFGSANELGANADKQLTLPGDDNLAVKIGEITVGVPDNDGTFMLDVVNADETDPDLGAQVRWGFGDNINGERLTTWRASTPNPDPDLTGGTMEICVGCIPDPPLIASQPDCDSTLPRTRNNVIRLTFGGLITEPVPGEIIIQEITDAGGTGPDLSSNFMFTVEGAGDILKIQEDGDVLSNETWYAVRNAGGWSGVETFEVDYVVVYGDATGNRETDVIDAAGVLAERVDPAPDDSRFDIDGNGAVDVIDAATGVLGNRGSTDPGKPTGHDCQ